MSSSTTQNKKANAAAGGNTSGDIDFA